MFGAACLSASDFWLKVRCLFSHIKIYMHMVKLLKICFYKNVFIKTLSIEAHITYPHDLFLCLVCYFPFHPICSHLSCLLCWPRGIPWSSLSMPSLSLFQRTSPLTDLSFPCMFVTLLCLQTCKLRTIFFPLAVDFSYISVSPSFKKKVSFSFFYVKENTSLFYKI